MSAASSIPLEAAAALTRVAVIAIQANPTVGTIQALLLRTPGGGWALPEDWGINGTSEAEAAERAALERAGLVGKVDPVPVGAYLAWARSGSAEKACIVNVFVMRVERQLPLGADASANWWLAVPEAAARIGDERIAAILRMAARRAEDELAERKGDRALAEEGGPRPVDLRRPRVR
jgi:ADP-ribose pyrophosphatase YjhB (NUDIX family)